MSKSLKIDKEFKSLIPPLLEDERKQLEENCIRDGIKDSLVIWNGILLDGHNRYEIAKEHGLDFSVTEMEFASREDAKLWIIKNQLGRRNLSAYDRSSLALKLKPLFAERSKERQRGGQGGVLLGQKSDEANEISTKKELAKIAGVSHDTIHKVEVIENSGNEKVIDKVKNREMSINKAYREVKGLPEKKPSSPIVEEIKTESVPMNEPVYEEPIPFEEYIDVESSDLEIVEHNDDSNNLLSEMTADMNRLAEMNSTYGVDVIQALKNSNLSKEEKHEFESCVERCIKALTHLKTGLLIW